MTEALTIPHGEEPIEIEYVFEAPPERVFRAWTEPKEIMAWFGPAPDCIIAVDIDLRVDGVWRFDLLDLARKKVRLQGKYLLVEQDKKLVFSFSSADIVQSASQNESTPSKVLVSFEPNNGGTRLCLRHEGISNPNEFFGAVKGWSSSLHHLAHFITVVRK